MSLKLNEGNNLYSLVNIFIRRGKLRNALDGKNICPLFRKFDSKYTTIIWKR